MTMFREMSSSSWVIELLQLVKGYGVVGSDNVLALAVVVVTGPVLVEELVEPFPAQHGVVVAHVIALLQ